jgi:hypothetical protein
MRLNAQLELTPGGQRPLESSVSITREILLTTRRAPMEPEIIVSSGGKRWTGRAKRSSVARIGLAGVNIRWLQAVAVGRTVSGVGVVL